MGKKTCSIIGLCDMHIMIHCSVLIFFLGGLTTMSYYKNNKLEVAGHDITVTHTNATTNTQVSDDHWVELKKQRGTCDLFSGKWVHDNKSQYPLYKEYECPYIEDTFACQTYGRKDSKYLQWRWQPHGCDFPRFNGKAIVERLRGKRLLFVGDSLNRNQWNSMICMLHSSIPGVKKADIGLMSGRLYTFRAKEYNISIDFYWAPMLVESNGDSPTNHSLNYRVVGIKAIEEHAKNWVKSDILVFNSYHWWRSFPVVKLLKSGGLMDDPNQEFEEVDSLLAYKMSLETWSHWVHTHIDPLKTKLFFMGATATHSRAAEWGGMNQNCYGEMEPVMDEKFWESQTDLKMLSILESSLSKLKDTGVNVQIINVTQVTQCRKDAHTTIYRKQWHPLTDQQKQNPRLISDCSHWCVPGVPDIWNELLLAYILG